ncbi:collagen alpha-1(I) chain [Salarias fasciatus]|uniref:collagen alpha-1(I) chain n=1 Tax=Salarias fasciatus TaxID=181472 RepID=UPI0011764B6B|nr:collagen alpha-1(I) chain-like [Salarias fasciatus]
MASGVGAGTGTGGSGPAALLAGLCHTDQDRPLPLWQDGNFSPCFNQLVLGALPHAAMAVCSACYLGMARCGPQQAPPPCSWTLRLLSALLLAALLAADVALAGVLRRPDVFLLLLCDGAGVLAWLLHAGAVAALRRTAWRWDGAVFESRRASEPGALRAGRGAGAAPPPLPPGVCVSLRRRRRLHAAHQRRGRLAAAAALELRPRHGGGGGGGRQRLRVAPLLPVAVAAAAPRPAWRAGPAGPGVPPAAQAPHRRRALVLRAVLGGLRGAEPRVPGGGRGHGAGRGGGAAAGAPHGVRPAVLRPGSAEGHRQPVQLRRAAAAQRPGELHGGGGGARQQGGLLRPGALRLHAALLRPQERLRLRGVQGGAVGARRPGVGHLRQGAAAARRRRRRRPGRLLAGRGGQPDERRHRPRGQLLQQLPRAVEPALPLRRHAVPAVPAGGRGLPGRAGRGAAPGAVQQVPGFSNRQQQQAHAALQGQPRQADDRNPLRDPSHQVLQLGGSLRPQGGGVPAPGAFPPQGRQVPGRPVRVHLGRAARAHLHPHLRHVRPAGTPADRRQGLHHPGPGGDADHPPQQLPLGPERRPGGQGVSGADPALLQPPQPGPAGPLRPGASGGRAHRRAVEPGVLLPGGARRRGGSAAARRQSARCQGLSGGSGGEGGFWEELLAGRHHRRTQQDQRRSLRGGPGPGRRPGLPGTLDPARLRPREHPVREGVRRRVLPGRDPGLRARRRPQRSAGRRPDGGGGERSDAEWRTEGPAGAGQSRVHGQAAVPAGRPAGGRGLGRGRAPDAALHPGPAAGEDPHPLHPPHRAGAPRRHGGPGRRRNHRQDRFAGGNPSSGGGGAQEVQEREPQEGGSWFRRFSTCCGVKTDSSSRCSGARGAGARFDPRPGPGGRPARRSGGGAEAGGGAGLERVPDLLGGRGGGPGLRHPHRSAAHASLEERVGLVAVSLISALKRTTRHTRQPVGGGGGVQLSSPAALLHRRPPVFGAPPAGVPLQPLRPGRHVLPDGVRLPGSGQLRLHRPASLPLRLRRRRRRRRHPHPPAGPGPEGHAGLLRHHAGGPRAEPLLLRPVRHRRQPAVHPQHPAGQRRQPAGRAGGDGLGAALGAAAAGAAGAGVPPHAALLPPHVPRAQAPLQPHAVARLLALLRDADRAGHRAGQRQRRQVRGGERPPPGAEPALPVPQHRRHAVAGHPPAADRRRRGDGPRHHRRGAASVQRGGSGPGGARPLVRPLHHLPAVGHHLQLHTDGDAAGECGADGGVLHQPAQRAAAAPPAAAPRLAPAGPAGVPGRGPGLQGGAPQRPGRGEPGGPARREGGHRGTHGLREVHHVPGSVPHGGAEPGPDPPGPAGHQHCGPGPAPVAAGHHPSGPLPVQRDRQGEPGPLRAAGGPPAAGGSGPVSPELGGQQDGGAGRRGGGQGTVLLCGTETAAVSGQSPADRRQGSVYR